MASTTADSSIEQEVAQAYLSGDTEAWFSLPAGPIGFATGVEYREERSTSKPAWQDRAGLTFGNKLEPVRGDYDVKELFAEVNVPLLNDLPGVQELNFDAAARLSDYSTIGNADTWKLGLVWQPIEDIILRGTLAEATRSPNIGELFDPGGQTFQLITDPCDVNQLANGTEFRADNCAQALNALGVDPATYTDPNSSSVAGILSGNPNLTEEVAETRTIGVILNPRFAPNLTISVDWYKIDLEDAINTASPEEAAQTCVDLPTLENDFCNLVTREDGTGALIDFIQQPQNVAEFITEGYDFTIDYAVDPMEWGLQRNIGLFNLRVVGNYLTDLEFVNLPGADSDDDLGEEDAPEWQFRLDLTWEYSQFLVNYSLSWFDETLRYSNQVREVNRDIVEARFWKYDERRVHDIHVAYEHREGLQLYAGVNNLTDQQPDIGRVFYPVSAVGRFFYFGIGMDLELFN
jgi:iron complex outermembrane recepter protein